MALLYGKDGPAAHIHGVAATVPGEAPRGRTADRYTRAAEVEDIYGPENPQAFERVALEDATLLGGIPTEEVLASVAQGWAINQTVAEACRAYECRKHSPDLLACDELPQDW